MLITPKFFKKNLPDMIPGDVAFRTVTSPARYRMFVREEDDSNSPSRVCVDMTQSEVIDLFNAMQEAFPFLNPDGAK